MKRKFLFALAGCVGLALLGCPSTDDARVSVDAEGAEEAAAPPAATASRQPEGVMSLLGEPLAQLVIPEEFRAQQEGLLAEAEAKRQDSPDDPETWIWVGRRTAYLGRYREAIGIYSRALEKFPDEPRLYRHRGHRHLSVRELDSAVADFEHAAGLIDGKPDQVEPDGLPNERGIPTSTLQSNIWYHLGLAHYLKGDFDEALAAYREDLAVSTNPDSLAATSYWLYLTLRRLGRDEEAAEVLARITPDMDIIENHEYHRLLLTYRRMADAHELWDEASAVAGAVNLPTVAYGMGAWHLVEGRPEKAREWFERTLASPSWSAFGYLAAEAEMARWLDSEPTGGAS